MSYVLLLWMLKHQEERLDDRAAALGGKETRGFSPAAEETALDDFDDKSCSFFLTHLWIKPASDSTNKQS